MDVTYRTYVCVCVCVRADMLVKSPVKTTVMEGAGDAGSAGETSLEERTRWTVHFNVTPLTKKVF